MEQDTAVPIVTTQGIMRRLRISRNYVTRNITHVVKQAANPYASTTIYFDEAALRRWLMQHATFTRQTIYIDLNMYLQDPALDNPKYEALIGKIPEKYDNKRRGLYPYIPVEPFDFWDKPLIFPKEYIDASGKKVSAEMCYREMFDQGAIKIQLGRQKTMFYIPPHNPDDFFVCADWIPMKGCQYLLNEDKKKKHPPLPKEEIQILLDCPLHLRSAAITALRKGFNIKRVLPYPAAPTEDQPVQDCYICTIKPKPAAKDSSAS